MYSAGAKIQAGPEAFPARSSSHDDTNSQPAWFGELTIKDRSVWGYIGCFPSKQRQNASTSECGAVELMPCARDACNAGAQPYVRIKVSQANFVVVPPQDVERARALIRSLTYELGFIRVDAVAVADIPDPVDVRVEVDGVNHLSLVALIEMTLSLAAVMPKHVVHAADVQEIIKRRRLPRSCAGELQPHLRDGFRALGCEPDPET